MMADSPNRAAQMAAADFEMFIQGSHYHVRPLPPI